MHACQKTIEKTFLIIFHLSCQLLILRKLFIIFLANDFFATFMLKFSSGVARHSTTLKRGLFILYEALSVFINGYLFR